MSARHARRPFLKKGLRPSPSTSTPSTGTRTVLDPENPGLSPRVPPGSRGPRRPAMPGRTGVPRGRASLSQRTFPPPGTWGPPSRRRGGCPVPQPGRRRPGTTIRCPGERRARKPEKPIGVSREIPTHARATVPRSAPTSPSRGRAARPRTSRAAGRRPRTSRPRRDHTAPRLGRLHSSPWLASVRSIPRAGGTAPLPPRS